MRIEEFPNIDELVYKKIINQVSIIDEYANQEINRVLDALRAEIEELKPNNPNFKGYFEQNVALNKVLEVIDKYKTESEE